MNVNNVKSYGLSMRIHESHRDDIFDILFDNYDEEEYVFGNNGILTFFCINKEIDNNFNSLLNKIGLCIPPTASRYLINI